jgi:hypothetical protein
MQRPRHTQTRRSWRTSQAAGPAPAARTGWRAVPGARPFAAARGRRATRQGRVGTMLPRRAAASGPFAARRKRSSGNSVMVRGRGLVGRQKRSKRSRKAPAALVAVLAGLGAASAAALKRRRGEEDQPTSYVPPAGPAAPKTSAAEASPPAGAA